MPIATYNPPQLTIEQGLEVTSSSSVPRMAACVIGPKYLLSRYGKETTYGVAHASGGQTIAWKYYDAAGALQTLPGTYTPDLASVTLHAVGLRATLATYLSGANKIYLNDLSTPNVIRIDTTTFAGTSRDTAFRGRDVAVGDIVRVNDGTTTRERRVVALRGKAVAASVGTGANGQYNPITAGQDAAVVLSKPAASTVTIVQTSVNFNVRGSSVISRKVAEEYTITCTTGGTFSTARFSITSKSGIYSAVNVAGSDGGSGAILINNAELAGATFQIDTPTTVTTGMVWRFRVSQAYETLDNGAEFVFAGTYTGPANTTYVVQVTQGTTGGTAAGAEVKIYDTAGLEEIQEGVVVAEDTAISLGAYGLTVTFNLDPSVAEPQDGLRAGDIYYINATAAAESTTSFDKLVLDGPVIDPATFVTVVNPLGASFHLYYTGVIASDASASGAAGSAWTADASGVDVASALSLYVPERDSSYEWVSFEDAVGTLYPSYRALVPVGVNEGRFMIADDAENAEVNGAVALENDLAFGVSESLRGAAGRVVYSLNTGGTSAAHFTAALKKLEATDEVYCLCALTDAADVRLAVQQHVLAMSAPDRKMFRKVYFGVDSPGVYQILSTQANSTPYTATVTDYGGSNLLVTLVAPADGLDFDSVAFEPGDLFRVTTTGTDYVIAEQISATELLLVSGPALPISPAAPFTIWAADTVANQKKFLRETVNALDQRRCTVVWYEDGTRTLSGATTLIPAKFAAAEVAGIRSAVPAQSGLTRTNVTAITNAPAMYNKYDTQDLNDIASEGVMIIMQSAENGAVYIRHQLTTEADNGLLYYEDNVTMIVDYLSFQFKDALDSTIGRVNVTDETIANLFATAVNILDNAKKANVKSLYGSLIVDYNGLTVARDANLRDRINISVNISVPIPLNQLNVSLQTYIDLPAAA
jgi:hypothetical protein